MRIISECRVIRIRFTTQITLHHITKLIFDTPNTKMSYGEIHRSSYLNINSFNYKITFNYGAGIIRNLDNPESRRRSRAFSRKCQALGVQ